MKALFPFAKGTILLFVKVSLTVMKGFLMFNFLVQTEYESFCPCSIIEKFLLSYLRPMFVSLIS